MSHFDHSASSWDSPKKVESVIKMAKKVNELVELGSDLDILDFGCGTGLFGLEFFDRAKSITGMDTSEGMLEVFDNKTKDHSNIKSVNLDLEKSELSEKYDLIISSMTFHHLENPLAVLRKLKESLNPKGRILVVDLEKEDGTFHPDNEGMGVRHFGFSNEELSSWAQELNLDIAIHTINEIGKNDRSYFQFLANYSLK